jgi:hypothetical protein
MWSDDEEARATAGGLTRKPEEASNPGAVHETDLREVEHHDVGVSTLHDRFPTRDRRHVELALHLDN